MLYPLNYYLEYDGSILRSKRGRCFKNAMIVCGYLRMKGPPSKKPVRKVKVPLTVIAAITDFYGRKTHPVLNETVYMGKVLVYVQGVKLPWFINNSSLQLFPLKLFFLGMESIRKFLIYELKYPGTVVAIVEFYIVKYKPRMCWFFNEREMLMETDKGLEMFRLDYFDDMMMYRQGFLQVLEYWKHMNRNSD
jgi:hypothetical protein